MLAVRFAIIVKVTVRYFIGSSGNLLVAVSVSKLTDNVLQLMAGGFLANKVCAACH